MRAGSIKFLIYLFLLRPFYPEWPTGPLRVTAATEDTGIVKTWPHWKLLLSISNVASILQVLRRKAPAHLPSSSNASQSPSILEEIFGFPCWAPGPAALTRNTKPCWSQWLPSGKNRSRVLATGDKPHAALHTVKDLLSVKDDVLQQVDMHTCISVFRNRLELACLTKHKESIIQIVNLWNKVQISEVNQTVQYLHLPTAETP